jgi:hypothetical protein
MAADKLRPRAGELLAQHQEPGEELLGASRAWVARVGPKGHVFFVGRHRHLVALTDRRLVAWRQPKRADATPAVDVPLSLVHLNAEHPSRAFFQLRLSVGTERGGETLVIELPHREHAFGRALARALHATPATPGSPAAPAAPAAS